jgi:hypothetical protein
VIAMMVQVILDQDIQIQAILKKFLLENVMMIMTVDQEIVYHKLLRLLIMGMVLNWL